MHNPDIAVLLILIAAAAASAHWRKLTPPAAAAGAVCGMAIYMGDGFQGLALLTLFFALGTAATSWRKKEKLNIRGAAAHQSTRRTGQVIANAGVAGIMAGLAILFPADKALFALMLAASLSSATADTLSSELGMVYGRRFFNILTLKTDERGLDGVVSLEGLLIGMIGSTLIALAYILVPHTQPIAPSTYILVPHTNIQAPYTPSSGHIANGTVLLIIVLAGTVGNLADSLLGALLERRGLLNNDWVNFLNTLIAALTAAALVGFNPPVSG